MLSPKDAKAAADVLTGLAEPSRIRLFETILAGPIAVSELARKVQMEIVNVSHHLMKLRRFGLVVVEHRGRQMIRAATLFTPHDLEGSPS